MNTGTSSILKHKPKMISWHKMADGGMFDFLNTNNNPPDPTLTLGTQAANPDIPMSNPGDSAVAMKSPMMTPITNTNTTNSQPSGVNWGAVGSTAQGIIPFASNIINGLRQTPKPSLPTPVAPAVFQKVNLDQDRNDIQRTMNASNAVADRSLASNTATAVRLFNQGQTLNQLSRVNQQERNENTSINNQQAQANAEAQRTNAAKMDDYNDKLLEQQIARQRNSSENVANAADKFESIQNEQAKAKLDNQKALTLMTMYRNSGVGPRELAAMKQAGVTEPWPGAYASLPTLNKDKADGTFKMGGRMASVKPVSVTKMAAMRKVC